MVCEKWDYAPEEFFGKPRNFSDRVLAQERRILEALHALMAMVNCVIRDGCRKLINE